jgi:transcriptional regulator with XRE-family HTH domain
MTPSRVSRSGTYMTGSRNIEAAAANSRFIDESLGIRLRDRRISFGLSQEQLAEKLQISPRNIYAYERGAKRMTADRLLQIARALDVRPNYFFQFSDQREDGAVENEQGPRENPPLRPTMFEEGLRLQRAFVSIENATIRQAIVDFVDELARSRMSD